MVFMEQSPADQLLGPLEGFAKSLDRALRPNREFQLAMQKAIAVNPQLAVQLSGLEKSAPGSLKAMGFGQLGDIISQIPEDITSQFNRENRQQILATDKGKLDVTQAEQGVTLDKITRTIDMLKNNPDVSRDEILHSLTGQTQAQQDEAVARANLMQTTANVRAAEAPGEIAKANLANEQLTQTLNNFPQLAQLDPVNLVRKMMNGGTIGPEFVQFMNLPGAQQAFQHAQTIAEMQATRDQNMWLRVQTLEQRKQAADPQEKANINNAAYMIRQTKVGTLDSWRAVLEDPATVLQIQDKLKAANGNMSALTQPERDIITSANEQSRLQAQVQQNEARKDAIALTKTVQEARIGLAKNPSPAGADLILAPVNSMLKEASQKNNTEPYTAVWGQIPAVGQTIGTKDRSFFHPGGGAPGLYFIDKNGVRVEDNQAMGIGPQGLTNEALQALTVLKGIKDPKVKQQSLERLKQQKPAIYNQVIGRLNQ